MAGYKYQRMAQDIRRIVYGKMRELKDPRVGGGETLTVTRVEVSHDGSSCKVYVSDLRSGENTENAVKGLTSATGIFKREISNVLGLRKCPDIKFIADTSGESSARIYEKLKGIKQELDEKESKQEDDGHQ
ncbi:MAG: 30S ribosome-binding factor RbfA [Ruminococcus sp.]|nr:30S ribosome-binding factor RbfA [Ruminococcus sp.]